MVKQRNKIHRGGTPNKVNNNNKKVNNNNKKVNNNKTNNNNKKVNNNKVNKSLTPITRNQLTNKIGILDPNGLKNNPLTGKPYENFYGNGESYREMSKIWVGQPMYNKLIKQ